ncbi:MAG TPA: tagaturonate reductase, partial [Candidatus Mediterraneibacter caccavium]|nr:tagaturonate reductase [Candidatus Mediterraneibacter caccavium]
RWVLEFYWDHRNDSAEDLVHAVMTDEQMWGQDLTQIVGFEKLTADNLKLIREKGALAAFASCL